MTGEHRLRQAFLRRSLAYDLSGIATFSVLDLWTQKLFEKMNEAPIANYSRRPALRSLLMLRSQSFQSMLKFYSTLILFKAMGATHMIVLKRPVLLERVRVHTTLTARESQQKEKEKPHRALAGWKMHRKGQTWKAMHGWISHVLEEGLSQVTSGQRMPTLLSDQYNQQQFHLCCHNI